MDDKKLISLLKKNDLLYNKNQPLANLEHKKEVWRIIAAKMRFPVHRVIKRYRALRGKTTHFSANGGRITWEGSEGETNLYLTADPLQVSSSAMYNDDSDTRPLSSATKSSKRTRGRRADSPIDDSTSAKRYKRRADSPIDCNNGPTHAKRVKRRADTPVDSNDGDSPVNSGNSSAESSVDTNGSTIDCNNGSSHVKRVKRRADSPVDSNDGNSLDNCVNSSAESSIENNGSTTRGKRVKIKPTDKKDITTSGNSDERKAESAIDGKDPANRTDLDDAFCEAVYSFKKLFNVGGTRKGNKALHGFGQMIVSTISEMNVSKQTRIMLLATEAFDRILGYTTKDTLVEIVKILRSWNN